MKFIKNDSKIYICDIGASPCDPTDHIENLLNNTDSFLYGFEPNEEEFNKLEITDKKKFFKKAIGDGSDQHLNICRYPGWTSFLEPDKDYIKKFHNFENNSEIIKQIPMKTEKLDEINFEKKIDFFKIDVQGFESIIIENGLNKISDALVVQLELSPVPIYKKEKNMSYVSNLMEKLNFNLNMFHKINTKAFKPMIIANKTTVGLHTIFQLDCVFVKNFEEIEKLDQDQLKKLILIMFYSFKSYDFVDYLINKLDKISSSNFTKEYRNLISTIKLSKKY
tara:strand:+ start:106 stop:942 length:837 start_codon:yes stop_codon:yes gene_type:complete